MEWALLARWWLAITLLGILGLPLSEMLFARLPGKGYWFGKSIALLLVAYFVWLGASLHLVPNSGAGVWLAILLVAALSGGRVLWLKSQGKLGDWRAWWQQNWRFVLATELLFLLAFAGWAELRSFNPSLYTGEKRMEFTIINGILNSHWFPPQDPWLAGYSINYYYFGHLMVVVLARLTGVDVAYGFNLAVALWFALSATAFFGLTTDLIRLGQTPMHRARVMALGLLSALMLLFMGNLTPLYDWFYQRGQVPAAVVRWLNLYTVSKHPPAGVWPENDWWWFKGARVLKDYGPQGHRHELFTDFPFISFFTGDLHAQTFSLPFMPIAISIALVLFLTVGSLTQRRKGAKEKRNKKIFAALRLCVRPVLMAVLLGGQVLMHPWDAPAIFALILGAVLLGAWAGGKLFTSLAGALGLVGLSFALYAPFWSQLQSPGMGLAVNLFVGTRLSLYLILFATFLLPILLFLWLLVRDEKTVLPRALKLFPPIFVAPALIAGVVMVIRRATGSPLLSGYHIYPEVIQQVNGWSWPELLRWFFISKAPGVGLWALLSAILAWILAWLWEKRASVGDSGVDVDRFILLLLALPVAATLLLEFVFIAEPLGIRVNSIFKFYYLAWEIYAIVAVYALARILQRKRPLWWSLLWALLLIPSFLYVILALPYGSGHFKGPQTLDSLAYLRRDMPDDMAGIAWLESHAAPDAVVLEAHTQNYTISHDALVSTITGNPTLVGWWDHELHWHGPAFEDVVKGRERACQQIYEAQDPQTLLSLLKKWRIDYFYVGNIERKTYNLSDKNIRIYDEALPLMFTQGGVRIYRVP